MPDTYVFAKNGMGDYEVGSGMREDMLMQVFNIFLNQAGVVLSGDLEATEQGTPGMGVTVAAGRCFVQNSGYSVNTANSTKYWGVLCEEFDLSIDSNTSGSTRYDIVIVEVDTVPTPNGYATNVATVRIEKGIAGSGVPTTPPNALKLAEIEVANGASSITNSEITDSRVFITIEDEYLGAEIQTYTPVFSADGGSPTIDVAGGGSLSGRYFKRGKKVVCWIEAMLGPGFSFGTGQIYFSLPFDVGANALPSYFLAEYEDVGTAIYYGQPLVFAGAPTKTHVLRVTRADVTYARGANVSATVPFTWASGDYIRLGPIIYETDQ